jgi:hypothetical protein
MHLDSWHTCHHWHILFCSVLFCSHVFYCISLLHCRRLRYIYPSERKYPALLLLLLILKHLHLNYKLSPCPTGVIELRDVDFAYPSRPNVQVCQGYNLVIRPGETVALCGASGAGKVNTNTAIFNNFSSYSIFHSALTIMVLLHTQCFTHFKSFPVLLLALSPLTVPHTVNNYEFAPALLRPLKGVSSPRQR